MLNRQIPPVHFSYPASLRFPAPESTEPGDRVRLHRYYHNDETAKIEFIIAAGAYDDDTPGKTLLTSKCLLSGTANTPAAQLSDRIASYGAFADIASSFDFTTVTLYSLSKDLPNLLPIMAELLGESIFPDAEVLLQRSVLANNVKTELKKSSVVASRKLRSTLFSSTGYGQLTTPEVLGCITTQEVRGWYAGRFGAMEIVATGSIADEMVSLAGELFSAGSLPERAALSDSSASETVTDERVKMAGAVQTSIRLGKKVINKGHDDYFTLVIACHLLGGFFGSKLMKDLREDKGLTYGIYAGITHLLRADILAISCDVKSSETKTALAAIKEQLFLLTDKAVTVDELELAKRHLTGSLQSKLSSSAAITNKFKNAYLYGLDMGFYDRLFQKIRSVEPDEIRAIASKYFAPDTFSVVCAGG